MTSRPSGARGCTPRRRRPGRGKARTAWAPVLSLLATLAPIAPAAAQQGYEYHQFTTELVWRGNQALTLCNGLWVSGRSIEEVYDHELASLLYGSRGGLRPFAPMPLDRVSIDLAEKTVAVGIDPQPFHPGRHLLVRVLKYFSIRINWRPGANG